MVTRRYPVDFAKVKERLSEDLAADYDFALYRAIVANRIELEAIGLNGRRAGAVAGPDAAAGLWRPVAYRTFAACPGGHDAGG